jgi:hypothetical protein
MQQDGAAANGAAVAAAAGGDAEQQQGQGGGDGAMDVDEAAEQQQQQQGGEGVDEQAQQQQQQQAAEELDPIARWSGVLLGVLQARYNLDGKPFSTDQVLTWMQQEQVGGVVLRAGVCGGGVWGRGAVYASVLLPVVLQTS